MSKRQSFEAHYSIPKLLLFIFGCLSFVVVGAIMFSHGLAGEGIFSAIVGASGVLFFGCFGFLGIIRIVDRRVQIEIDSNGVMLRELSPQFIPHRSIKAVELDNNFIWLSLRKPENYPVRGLFRRLNNKFGGGYPNGAIYIVRVQYDRSMEEMLDAIEHFQPKTKHQLEVERLVTDSSSD